MSLQDFAHFFSDLTICYYFPNNIYCSQRIETTTRRSSYLELQVRQKGRYFVSLVQKNKRNYSRNFKYSDGRIVILRRGQNEYEFVGAIQRKDREIWLDLELNPGKQQQISHSLSNAPS